MSWIFAAVAVLSVVLAYVAGRQHPNPSPSFDRTLTLMTAAAAGAQLLNAMPAESDVRPQLEGMLNEWTGRILDLPAGMAAAEVAELNARRSSRFLFVVALVAAGAGSLGMLTR